MRIVAVTGNNVWRNAYIIRLFQVCLLPFSFYGCHTHLAIYLGLHASISTHICHGDLNQTTGERRKNLQCFVNRVASHPERLQYIYFNTVLLLRAVARIGPYLSAYDYCAFGTHVDDAQTLEKVSKVVEIASEVGRFDETTLFRGEDANVCAVLLLMTLLLTFSLVLD